MKSGIGSLWHGYVPSFYFKGNLNLLRKKNLRVEARWLDQELGFVFWLGKIQAEIDYLPKSQSLNGESIAISIIVSRRYRFVQLLF